jgi:hypothetical protein
MNCGNSPRGTGKALSCFNQNPSVSMHRPAKIHNHHRGMTQGS